MISLGLVDEVTPNYSFNARQDHRTFVQGVQVQALASMAVGEDQDVTSMGSHMTSFL